MMMAIIGKRICDVCGDDCTYVYGFALERRGNLNAGQQAGFNKIKEKFGKQELSVCVFCAAKAFGIKEIKEQEQEKPVAKNDGFFRKPEKTSEPAVANKGV
jgi:hypothetical protein